MNRIHETVSYISTLLLVLLCRYTPVVELLVPEGIIRSVVSVLALT